MSDKTEKSAAVVLKWLDGGASSWGYPESQIRHLADVTPELLSILVETTARLNLCGTGPRDLDIVERANALISKARGES